MEKSGLFIVSPEFGGYLSKRGFYWRKQWKKRWVNLLFPLISYYFRLFLLISLYFSFFLFLFISSYLKGYFTWN